jgi:putative addiction module component (TIGR02574 family)
MSSAIESLKDQVATLSTRERAELAYFLLTSIEPEDIGAEAAWDAEASRRVEEIRSGRAVGRPAEELLAELREQFP